MKIKLTFVFILSLWHMQLCAQNSYIKKQLQHADTCENHEQIEVYKKYAKYLNAERLHVLAHCYASEYCQSNYSKSIALLKKCAKQGIPCAIANLAFNYETGFTINKNLDSAKYWYSILEKSKIKSAMYIVATKYCEGKIISYNKDKAFQLFRASGYKPAKINSTFLNSLADTSLYKTFDLEQITILNKLKNGEQDSINIYLPAQTNSSYLIKKQLDFFEEYFNTNNKNIFIQTNGNTCMDAQQFSWQLARSVEKYFTEKKYDKNIQIGFAYGGNLMPEIITIYFTNKDLSNYNLPPLMPNGYLNNFYNLCGSASYLP